MDHRLAATAVGLAFACAASGCGGRKALSTSSEAPDWTQSISGIDQAQEGRRMFYAVGTWQNAAGDLAAGRDLAKANALKQLAEVLKTKQSSLVGAFNQVVGTEDRTRVSLEKLGRVIQEQVTSQALSGVLCPKVHYDRKNDITYVRCEMDSETFKEMAAQFKGLDEATKTLVQRDAAKAFAELREATQ